MSSRSTKEYSWTFQYEKVKCIFTAIRFDFACKFIRQSLEGVWRYESILCMHLIKSNVEGFDVFTAVYGTRGWQSYNRVGRTSLLEHRSQNNDFITTSLFNSCWILTHLWYFKIICLFKDECRTIYRFLTSARLGNCTSNVLWRSFLISKVRCRWRYRYIYIALRNAVQFHSLRNSILEFEFERACSSSNKILFSFTLLGRQNVEFETLADIITIFLTQALFSHKTLPPQYRNNLIVVPSFLKCNFLQRLKGNRIGSLLMTRVCSLTGRPPVTASLGAIIGCIW